MFKPYSIIKIPVLDVKSLRVEITTKTLKEKLADLNRLYEYLARLNAYQQYQKSMFEIGKKSNSNEIKKYLRKSEEILKEVILFVGDFSKTLGAL